MDGDREAPNPKKFDRVKAKWGLFLALGLGLGLVLFLIAGAFVSAKYRAFKVNTVDAIHYQIDKSLEKDKKRQAKRKKLSVALTKIYYLAEENKLSFVGLSAVLKSHEVTMADESLTDSEIEGLLGLYNDIIAKEGDIPFKEADAYTDRAKNIR